MKATYTVYRVCVKQTPSEDDPNGVFEIHVFGTYREAVTFCKDYLNGTPVEISCFGDEGIMFRVTDRDAVEQADGGIAHITITPHEVNIETANLRQYQTKTK